MFSKLQLHLSKVFLKIFMRDRQSIFFSLFFPIIFMTVFAFVSSDEQDYIDIGIVNSSANDAAASFIQLLMDDPLFQVTVGEESALREQLIAGEQTLLLVLPESFAQSVAESSAEPLAQSSTGTSASSTSSVPSASSTPSPSSTLPNQSTELRLLVDAAQVRQLGLIMPVLEQTLISIEREFRGIEPMFTLAIEDVQARSQRYLDFLLPGLLAFTLMQLSIAGSGFNIVEYRRKGILKRLFVTPIRPRDFITSIVMARMSIVLIQLTILLLFAIFLLDIRIVGDFFTFYVMVILGTVVFLCLGFCLGSIAKTQQAVMAVGNIVIFPQIFLSGVFYPIESMPAFIQPLARILPLSYLSTGMRDIANNGASLLEIAPSLLGIAVWFVIAFILATRLFVWKEVAN
ncbi:MAG: ABC transporter permease [Pseudohongiellaceae bacterium]